MPHRVHHRRRRALLAGAVLTSGVLVAGPPAQADPAGVQLGAGSSSVAVSSGNGAPDARESPDSSFSATVESINPPRRASAQLSTGASRNDSTGVVSIGGHASTDLTGDDLARSRALLRRSFTVTERAPYRLNWNARGVVRDGFVPKFEMRLAEPGGEPIVRVTNRNREVWHRRGRTTGSLAKGTYELLVTSECRRTCTEDWRGGLLVGGDDESAPPLALSGGPSGLVAQSSGLFEFVLVEADPPPGALECSLDGAPFAACSSPHAVSGLDDGDHVFAVRFHPEDGTPDRPSERRWTIDTTAPAVVFDRAPTGEDNPADTEIAFHATEPDGAAFTCSLDSGPLFECSSPHAVVDLADGPHSFTVQASDRVDNVSVPSTVTWTVGAREPLATAACPDGLAEVKLGPVRLVARAPDACFVAETIDGRPAKVSRGQVTMNGIRLTPGAGTRLIVEERIGDGRVRTDGPVTLGFGGFPVTLPLGIDLDGLVANSSRVNSVLSLGSNVAKLYGAKVLPTLETVFTEANGGTATVTFRFTLPTATFKRLPGRAEEGVTFELSPTFSNDRGMTVAGRVKVGVLYILGHKVKDAELFFDHGSGRIEGKGGLALAPERPPLAQETLTATWAVNVGDEACGLEKLAIAASNQQKHIGDGVHLQRLGGSFECVMANGRRVMVLSANAGLSFGPRIATRLFEGEIASIDGVAKLSLPITAEPAPFTVEMQGEGKLVELPVTKLGFKYTSPFHFEQTASLDLTLSGYGVRLEQRHFYLGLNGYSIDFAGQLDLFGIKTTAEGIVSTRGYAFCFGPPGERVGFGKPWTGVLDDPMAACDVAPFAVGTAASAAQAGRSFSIARGTTLKVIAIDGADAPPKVSVNGPGGRRLETPAGPGGIDAGKTLLVQDTVADTTFVILRDPAPGRWTVAPLPGSGPIRRVRLAGALPRVGIAARVTGAGARRTLRWKATGLGRQQIEFAERGKRGAGQVLATTRRSRGRLTFAPDLALGRSRTIEATIYNGGMPRLTRTTARFRVTPPPRVRAVQKLRLRGATLRWRAQRAAARYELALVHPDGTSTSHTTRRAALRLGASRPRGDLRVVLLAVDALGRSGPVTRARFHPAKPKQG